MYTIHELSESSQRFYACNGHVHVDTLGEASRYAPERLCSAVPTRYVLHFQSPYRHYIMDKLAEHMIPHTRNIDGQTTEVLRMVKQPRIKKTF